MIDKSMKKIFFLLIIVVFSLSGLVRNCLWNDEKALWQDCLNKAPGKKRPYHNLGLAGILRTDIPLGASPVSPYVGGGAGVHFVVSDADAMLGLIEQQGTGEPAIDPYDHIFPSAEGVLGLTFQPMGVPVSMFGEVRLSKPFGDDAGDAIVTYFGGANIGF